MAYTKTTKKFETPVETPVETKPNYDKTLLSIDKKYGIGLTKSQEYLKVNCHLKIEDGHYENYCVLLPTEDVIKALESLQD